MFLFRRFLHFFISTLHNQTLKHVKGKMWHQSARFENSWPPFCQVWIISLTWSCQSRQQVGENSNEIIWRLGGYPQIVGFFLLWLPAAGDTCVVNISRACLKGLPPVTCQTVTRRVACLALLDRELTTSFEEKGQNCATSWIEKKHPQNGLLVGFMHDLHFQITITVISFKIYIDPPPFWSPERPKMFNQPVLCFACVCNIHIIYKLYIVMQQCLYIDMYDDACVYIRRYSLMILEHHANNPVGSIWFYMVIV